MKTTGEHVTADIWLDEFNFNADDLIKFVDQALIESGMKVLGDAVHDFGGGAFTGVWLLAESHFSIHTFPERNYLSLDCYTCGEGGKPLACIAAFSRHLLVSHSVVRSMKRGV